MWLKFLELFDKPVGYLLVFEILLFIYCCKIYYKKDNKYKGYTKVYDDASLNPLYSAIMGITLLIIFFTIFYLFGFNDETGAILDGHILLFLGLSYGGIFLFLLFFYDRTYFNDKEIIVSRLLKRTKKIYWEDITNLVVLDGQETIVKTNKGNFMVLHNLKNVGKFLKLLEEKKYPNKEINIIDKIKKVTSVPKKMLFKLKKKRSAYGRKR